MSVRSGRELLDLRSDAKCAETEFSLKCFKIHLVIYIICKITPVCKIMLDKFEFYLFLRFRQDGGLVGIQSSLTAWEYQEPGLQYGEGCVC